MKLFIGCSASRDIPREYYDDCKVFLQKLMKGNDLVFGAYREGLMGLSYHTTLEGGGKVIGICPLAYQDDFLSLKCHTEITTKSVGERTESVITNSDALIFLPGGIGTIYELFTAIESKRCHEFDKPIVIYNANGYFDKLLEFMDKIYDEKFAKLKDKNNYLVSQSLPVILYYIHNYQNIKEELEYQITFQTIKEKYDKPNHETEDVVLKKIRSY